MNKPDALEENEQDQLKEDSPGEQGFSPPDEKPRKANPFNFWRGLQTVLGAAIIVASLFTLWTPGSLVESGLEARMAQALQSAQEENAVVDEPVLDPEQDLESNRIGIVAGHYGSDPGAVCSNGVTEAEVNLEIATMVQKQLVDLGYEVDLLEEFDPRLIGYQGAVVVSIHLDSCEYVNDQATGFKVAAALSTQNVADSQRLVACMSDRYNKVTGLPYHAGSVTDDMTYYHAFNEIAPETNAAIIEAGFMNMDYRFLTERTDVVAEGIVAGILCYINNEAIQSNQNP
jgi:N-acetylmuramoyl-L-alanine amidase